MDKKMILNGINGYFENWTSATCYYPNNYFYNSNRKAASEFLKNSVSFNVTQTTNAYSGSCTVELKTEKVGSDTIAGYMLTSAMSNNLSLGMGE
jgi:hypothetical protein